MKKDTKEEGNGEGGQLRGKREKKTPRIAITASKTSTQRNINCIHQNKECKKEIKTRTGTGCEIR